jgi:hypothetical protein
MTYGSLAKVGSRIMLSVKRAFLKQPLHFLNEDSSEQSGDPETRRRGQLPMVHLTQHMKLSFHQLLDGLQGWRPKGVVKVDYQYDASGFMGRVEIPEGVTAQVSMPVNWGERSVEVDGRPFLGVPTEDGMRLSIPVSSSGSHELHSHLSLP